MQVKEVCAGGGICITFKNYTCIINCIINSIMAVYCHYLEEVVCVCVMGRKAGSPSRHERLKVRVGSISFLILMSASSTMAPQWLRSTSYCCMWGLSGFSGSCVADRMLASVGYTILFASS